MHPMLSQLAESVTEARSLESLTRPLLELLQAVTGLESTYLTTIDELAGVQRILYARNTRELQIPEGLSVPWGDTLCRRALEEGRPYTDDVASCWGDSDAARQLGIVTYLSTPIRSEATGLFGTLCAASADRVPLSAEAQSVLSLFAKLIAQQVEREALIEQLRRANAELAEHALLDALTGLPNRRALMLEIDRALAQARRDHRVLLVGFVDLDGFKAINDRHGHEVGDRFLAAMGQRLAEGMRAGDMVGRYGGDEFVVLAAGGGGSSGDAEAAQLQQRLSALTVASFQLDALTLDYPGASVGVIAVDHENNAETVLKKADAAMYAVKQQRKPRR